MGVTSCYCCNFAFPPAKIYLLQIVYPNGICNYQNVIINSSTHFLFFIRFFQIRCAVVYSFLNCIISFFIIRSCCRLFFLQLYHQALSTFTYCPVGLYLYLYHQALSASSVNQQVSISICIIRRYPLLPVNQQVSISICIIRHYLLLPVNE